MLNELIKIFENARGQAVSLFKQSDKNTCVEIVCSEPELIFTTENFSYRKNKNIIELFDKSNFNKHVDVDISCFIGADSEKNEFWINTDYYVFVIY